MQTEENKQKEEPQTPPPPTGEQPPTVLPAQAPPEGDDDNKVIPVKHGDFKKIKDEARSKGRSDTLSEMEAKAKANGYDSLDDLLATKKPSKTETPTERKVPTPMATTPTTPPNKTTAPKKPGERATPPGAPSKQQRADLQRADKDAKLRKDWRQGQRQIRELKRQNDAKDAERELIIEMTRKGVSDPDYMLRQLALAMQGKSEEEMAKFDRNSFYEEQRKARPYLFGEVVVPATTGTSGGVKPTETQPPAPPAAGKPTTEEAAKKQFDANKAKPEEVQDRLKSLGVNPHV